jgi:hypothetical protein
MKVVSSIRRRFRGDSGRISGWTLLGLVILAWLGLLLAVSLGYVRVPFFSENY